MDDINSMETTTEASRDFQRRSETPERPEAAGDATPEASPEPEDGAQSPGSQERKREANRRAALKSRQKKVVQLEAQKITLKALEEDNEALRREIRLLMHASGAAGMHETERHEHVEDEYNLPSHSFNHAHPFGGHGGEGEGVEGLLGLGAGLGELANVAVAADQNPGYPSYAAHVSHAQSIRDALKDSGEVKLSPLLSPTDLAVAALRKSIQAHRTALASSPDAQKEQSIREQIEAVKAATAQRDKELSVLQGVLHRMTLARKQTQSELEALRAELVQIIDDAGSADTGPLRYARETDEVRRALREVRTYVETLVKGWKEDGTVPQPPVSVTPFLPPLPVLSGSASFAHAHLGNLPLPSSLPKRRGRPSKSRPSPALLPDSLRHLVPLPDEVRARDDIVPMPKRRKLRDDEMRGRPREFGNSQPAPETEQQAAAEQTDAAPELHERQTLELLEGLAHSRHGDEGTRPAGEQPLTLEQAAAAFSHGQSMTDMDLHDLDDVISGRRSKRSADVLGARARQ